MQTCRVEVQRQFISRLIECSIMFHQNDGLTRVVGCYMRLIPQPLIYNDPGTHPI